MVFNRKHLLGLKDMTKEEIEYILYSAKTMKLIIDSKNKKTPHLQGKSIVSLFYENSTRTKLSFELAGKYLGASTSSISPSTSSVQKGENLIDTVKTIDVMGTDVIICRHSMAGVPKIISQNVDASVINAGDGMNEHPTQALLDIFTMKEKLGDIKGKRVAILGDILHSRVARSNIWGLNKLGASISVAGPSTMIPKYLGEMGVDVYYTVQEALLDADIVISLRIQKERQSKSFYPSNKEYYRFFGIDENRLKLADEKVIIMHPGPVNRGIELNTNIADSKQSTINEQVKNGVAIRMALLYLLTRKENI